MKRQSIPKLITRFDRLLHRESRSGTEYWLARELQPALGYSRWNDFAQLNPESRGSL